MSHRAVLVGNTIKGERFMIHQTQDLMDKIAKYKMGNPRPFEDPIW